MNRSRFFIFIFSLGVILCSCPEKPEKAAVERDEVAEGWYEPMTGCRMPAIDTSRIPCGVTELLPGDILVRANNNWLPGTSVVPGGYTFGHAAVVIRGGRHPDPDSLLAMVVVMESNSRDLPPEEQVRLVPGYLVNPDPHRSNLSFGPAYQGIRYRLRLPLTGIQRDSLIAFLLRQDSCNSSWRALKDEGRETNDEGGSEFENRSWYCTLLIGEAFRYAAGVDIDANSGWVVYPNDVIASPLFDNRPGDPARRVRF